MQLTPPSKASKKLQQFLNEVNEVCDRYQYRFQPILRYNADGIVPSFNVEEVPPKEKPKGKKK